MAEQIKSYLEQKADAARGSNLVNNLFQYTDEYNENHREALASESDRGKGLGSASKGTEAASSTLPSHTASTEPDQSRFSYSDDNMPGNCQDRYYRKKMMANQLYGPENQYYYDVSIDTSENVAAGQYNETLYSKPVFTCPKV
jgi:hypothetical protein